MPEKGQKNNPLPPLMEKGGNQVTNFISAIHVGLSNILDGELRGRKPGQWPHGKVIGTTVMDGKLLCKVVQGVKVMTRIKAFLILPVATLHLTIVARSIGTNELVSDCQFSGGNFK